MLLLPDMTGRWRKSRRAWEKYRYMMIWDASAVVYANMYSGKK